VIHFEECAIIGGSGFIGKNLSRLLAEHRVSTNLLNSSSDKADYRNINAQVVFIAAPQALKWWANLNPAEDSKHIDKLIDNLSYMENSNVVLFSTIDVMKKSIWSNETTNEFEETEAYGLNRRKLELFCTELFPDLHIIRLPALVGVGLKKNVFFDLVNQNQLEKIDLRSTYQWYVLDHLVYDIQKVLKSDLNVVNLVSEPLPTFELVEKVFPELLEALQKTSNNSSISATHYDFKSKHADLWREDSSGYMFSKEQSINALIDHRRAFWTGNNED
jgi:nucleoside-diphosphate-sugar epimerase